MITFETSNSHYGFDLAGPWGLFLKDAIPLISGTSETILWGPAVAG